MTPVAAPAPNAAPSRPARAGHQSRTERPTRRAERAPRAAAGPFGAVRFTPTPFYTAEDKAAFANTLVCFIERGFPEHAFTTAFYRTLSNTFGHIAHYNREGFFATWFLRLEDQVRFLENIVAFPTYGDPAFTHCDVERAVKSWVLAGDVLDTLRARRDAERQARELATLRQLAAAHGVTIVEPEAVTLQQEAALDVAAGRAETIAGARTAIVEREAQLALL